MFLFSLKSNRTNLLNYLKTTTRTGHGPDKAEMSNLKHKEDLMRKETQYFKEEKRKDSASPKKKSKQSKEESKDFSITI